MFLKWWILLLSGLVFLSSCVFDVNDNQVFLSSSFLLNLSNASAFLNGSQICSLNNSCGSVFNNDLLAANNVWSGNNTYIGSVTVSNTELLDVNNSLVVRSVNGDIVANINGSTSSSNSNIFFNAPVGVGTNSPDESLEVFNGNLKIGDDAGSSRSLLLERSGSLVGSLSTANSITTLRGLNSGGIDFRTAGGNLVRISDDGDLGLGTAPKVYSGANKVLSIKGSTQSALELIGSRTTNFVFGLISFVNVQSIETDKTVAYIQAVRDGNHSSALLRFLVSERGVFKTALEVQADGDIVMDSDTFFLDATNDKIGVKTTTPTYALEVAVSGDSIALTDSGDGEELRARIGDAGNNGGFLGLTKDDGTESVFLRSYGDSFFSGGGLVIGGTSLPSDAQVLIETSRDKMLHLKSSGGGSQLFLETTAGGDVQMVMKNADGQWTFRVDNSEAEDLEIQWNGADVMELKTNKDVMMKGDVNITGNLRVFGNLNVSGCIGYNGGTLGTCV